MSLRIDQVPALLGARLTQFWPADDPGQPDITCVTVLEQPAEAATTRRGELALLTTGGLAQDVPAVLAALTAHRAAGLLLPAVPDCLDPAPLREQAIRAGLSIGVLAAGAVPRLIANELGRLVGADAPTTTYTPLQAPGTLQDLAETLDRQVGNSVTIESPRHELLAFSSMRFPVDRVREETILRRRGSPIKILSWLTREGYLAPLWKSDHPVRLPANEAMDFSGRVALRVAVGDEILAVIWVMETARRLGPREFAAIEQAANVAAAILLQQRQAVRQQAELRAELLEDMVRGRIRAPESVRALALNVGWDVDRPQQALVIAIDHVEAFRLRHADPNGYRLQGARARLAEIVTLEITAVDPSAVIGQRSTGMVVLYKVASSSAAQKATALRLSSRIVQRVAQMIAEMTITIGVGRVVPAFDQMAESFRQAELAAQLGASLWGGNRAVHYDDLGVHRLLFAMREHDEMLTPALQRLVEHDRQHHTEYVRTLSAYFSCMGRLRAAAERLGIHRNTLEYRMERIQKLADADLDDPDNRLALELGIRLLEMQRGAGAEHADHPPP